MSEERRQFIRLDARLTTSYKVLSTGRIHRALTKNISGIGLRVIAEEHLPVGTQLELEIKLPDGKTPIVCTGSVVWSQPSGAPRKSYEDPVIDVGVKFDRIDPKDANAIKHFAAMNALPPMPDHV